MARINLTKDEKRDIKAALKGLKAAQRRAMKSSNPITMVVDDQLIRRDAAGEITVLETIPSVKVTVSFKRSRHREN